jgi:hypothetical protein
VTDQQLTNEEKMVQCLVLLKDIQKQIQDAVYQGLDWDRLLEAQRMETEEILAAWRIAYENKNVDYVNMISSKSGAVEKTLEETSVNAPASQDATLTFWEREPVGNRRVWDILSGNARMGSIHWWEPWNCYLAQFVSDAILPAKTLRTVSAFCEQKTKEWGYGLLEKVETENVNLVSGPGISLVADQQGGVTVSETGDDTGGDLLYFGLIPGHTHPGLSHHSGCSACEMGRAPLEPCVGLHGWSCGRGIKVNRRLK